VIGLFFFVKSTINSRLFLDMLEDYAISQFADDLDIIFHFGVIVRQGIHKDSPERRLGKGEPIL